MGRALAVFGFAFFGLTMLALLAYGQSEVAAHPEAKTSIIQSWLFSPTTVACAFAGFLGGLLGVLLWPPRTVSSAARELGISLLSCMLIVPGVVSSLFSGISTDVLMAGCTVTAVVFHKLWPRILTRFDKTVITTVLGPDSEGARTTIESKTTIE